MPAHVQYTYERSQSAVHTSVSFENPPSLARARVVKDNAEQDGYTFGLVRACMFFVFVFAFCFNVEHCAGTGLLTTAGRTAPTGFLPQPCE